MKKIVIILFLSFIAVLQVVGQCDNDVPVFNIDFSNDPEAVWISDWIQKDNDCCNGDSDNCVQFIVTLSPDAEGLIIDLYSGFYISSNLSYQAECGVNILRGEPVCLEGPGPHSLTFCNGEDFSNKYYIKSLPKPNLGVSVMVAQGCQDTIIATGFNSATTAWRSIYPGALGQYDNYLDCTIACDRAVVTTQSNAPDFIDFQVCGFALSLCDTIGICDTVRVYFMDSLATSISPFEPSVCFGTSTTTITAETFGGEPPYWYLWSTGETSQSIEVGEGTYSVIVGDGGDCYTMSSEVYVSMFADSISVDAGEDISICYQNNQVQLNGIVYGVSTGVWSGGEGYFLPDNTTLNAIYYPSAAELTASSIQLQLKSSNSFECPSDSDYVMINIGSFSGDYSISIDSLTCFESTDGSAEITVQNGTYTYQWDDLSLSTSSQITNLESGIYTLIITDSIGCDSTITVQVYQPDQLLIDSILSINPLCYNDNTGSIEIFVSGGSNPIEYDYGISDQDISSNSINQLEATSYALSISDLNGCSVDSVINLSNPNELLLLIDSIGEIACNGGNTGFASVNAIGGIGTYQYSWDVNGSYFNGQVANELYAGTYQVYVEDENSCTDSIAIIISEASLIEMSIISTTNVNCFNDNTGSASIEIQGGNAPYQIEWDDEANNQLGNTAIGLSAGNFIISVIDSSLCSAQFSVEISSPSEALNINYTMSSPSCFGEENASASIEVNGGTSPYSYNWTSLPGIQNDSLIENIPAGTYIAIISDSNGCTDSVSIDINSPEILLVETQFDSILCFQADNASAFINASGGVEPYSYLWNIDSGIVDQSISGLIPDTYTYSVSDANNCISQGSITITENSELILSLSEDQIICSGEIAMLSANIIGGVEPITYNWENLGDGQNQSIEVDYSTSFQVQAIDGLGCLSNMEEVNVEVINVLNASLMLSNSGDVCIGESATLTAIYTAYDEAFTYNWGNNLGDSLGTIEVNPSESSWYTFEINDQCGNTLYDSTHVQVNEIPEVLISFDQMEGCVPFEVSASNVFNQSNYNYEWNMGDGSTYFSQNPSHSFETSGEFNIELSVLSDEGCSNTVYLENYIVAHASPISDFIADPFVSDILNPFINFTNTSQGEISIYSWNFGDGDESEMENITHEYKEIGQFNATLYVENGNGCSDSIMKIITINPNHDIVVPTAFTPNTLSSNNGFYDPTALNNDVFYPLISEVDNFQMQIYNRWGEVIFESRNYKQGWDGYFHNDLVQQGAYVYVIEVNFKDGESASKSGKIQLLK